MTRFLSSLVALAALLLAGLTAHAVMLPASTEWLSGEADLVVLGRVAQVEGRLVPGTDSVVTRVLVEVEEVVRGQAPAGPVIVEHQGGKAGDLLVMVSDAPYMEPGQRVLLFLERAHSLLGPEQVYAVLAEAQGRYVIDASGRARKDGFTVIQPSTKTRVLVDNNLPLGDLLRKVRQAQ